MIDTSEWFFLVYFIIIIQGNKNNMTENMIKPFNE